MIQFLNKKNLIILSLLFILTSTGVIFWRAEKSWGNLSCLLGFSEKQKCLIVNLEKFTVIKKETDSFQTFSLTSDNLAQGNSGQVDLAINLDKNPPEISWPKEYSLRIIKLEDLGGGIFTDDNRIIGELPFENKKITANFFPLGQIVDGDKLNPDQFPPLEKIGFRRYLITATFEKDNKISKGIFGFTY